MIILALVVVGAASYFRARRRPLPVRRPAHRLRPHRRCPARRPRRWRPQISERIEEAVNTLEGIDELRSVSAAGRVVRDRHLQPRPRHRRRRPGRARPRRARCCATCPRDADPPVVTKFDNDSGPGPDARALRPALAARADRAGRQDRQGAARAVLGRRARSGSSAGSSAPSTCGSTPTGWPPTRSPSPPCATRSSRQNADVPGRQRHRRRPRRRPCAPLGRIADPARFRDDLVVDTVNGAPIRVRDIGWAEDGTQGAALARRGSTACPR